MTREDEPAGNLPAGSYHASHYYDPQERRDVWRVFYEDGRVEAFDGDEWWTVCTFMPDQVARAKEAIRTSGLPEASDLHADDVHDAARLTYAWRLGGETGSVTNSAYPAETIAEFDALDEQLDALEAEAGAEWSTL
jgi:hypothetical protein